MIRKWKYNIGIMLAIATLIALFAFSKKRNGFRKLTQKPVEFVGGQVFFGSENFVNKLLIQKPKNDSIASKETLVLSRKEQLLENEPHIENAEVYVTVTGEISAKVLQPVPLARFYGAEPSYLDGRGFTIPLSKNNAVRVPLVYHFSPEHKQGLMILLEEIKKDDFLEKRVVGIKCLPNKDFGLQLRKYNFSVHLGGVERLPLKFKNLKAFYAKAQKDKLFDTYSKVNLGITNQVICTKKV